MSYFAAVDGMVVGDDSAVVGVVVGGVGGVSSVAGAALVAVDACHE